MFSFHYGIHLKRKGIEVMKTPKDFKSGGNLSSYVLGLYGNCVGIMLNLQ